MKVKEKGATFSFTFDELMHMMGYERGLMQENVNAGGSGKTVFRLTGVPMDIVVRIENSLVLGDLTTRCQISAVDKGTGWGAQGSEIHYDSAGTDKFNQLTIDRYRHGGVITISPDGQLGIISMGKIMTEATVLLIFLQLSTTVTDMLAKNFCGSLSKKFNEAKYSKVAKAEKKQIQKQQREHLRRKQSRDKMRQATKDPGVFAIYRDVITSEVARLEVNVKTGDSSLGELSEREVAREAQRRKLRRGERHNATAAYPSTVEEKEAMQGNGAI